MSEQELLEMLEKKMMAAQAALNECVWVAGELRVRNRNSRELRSIESSLKSKANFDYADGLLADYRGTRLVSE